MSVFKFTRLSLLAAAATVALSAQAVPVYSVASPSGTYGLASSYLISGVAGVANNTNNQHAAPVGLANGSSYFYVTPDAGKITVDVNASNFTFLWGSPDASNKVTFRTTLGDFAYTGTDLFNTFGISNNGNQSVATSFNASLAGGSIQTAVFTSGAISFEYAVAAVPEPSAMMLSLAGLGVLAVALRRKA